jgi:hypothetical protein
MTNKAKGHSHFSWQSGYGAFSVSQSAKESVIAYIASQEIHHRSMSAMCGTDQNKTLGPFRANRLMGCAPGVKTPG